MFICTYYCKRGCAQLDAAAKWIVCVCISWWETITESEHGRLVCVWLTDLTYCPYVAPGDAVGVAIVVPPGDG